MRRWAAVISFVTTLSLVGCCHWSSSRNRQINHLTASSPSRPHTKTSDNDEDSSAPLADSPWPKARCNLANTGRSHYEGPKRGRIKWKVSFGSADQWVSPAIGADGIIFIGSYGDERSSSSGPLGRKFGRLVFAITPEGKTKWTFKAEDALKSTPAVASDGTIYIMDWLTRLYALRADGKLKWKINLIKDGRAYNSAPAIGSHGTIYVNAENNLFAVTPSGKVKWKFTASDNVGSPAVSQGRSPELVYFGSRNQFLYCVFGDGSYDKEGKEYWHVSPGATSTPVLGGGGVCCAAVTAGLLGTKPGIFCVTPQLIWKYEWDEKYVPVSIPAVGPDETVYLIHMKKGLLAFTPKGKLKWVLKPEIVGRGPGFRGSPAIDRNGTLYVGTSNGVWAVNPKGKIEWKLNLNESAGSPAIGYNQTLYVATWEGHLFAIGE